MNQECWLISTYAKSDEQLKVCADSIKGHNHVVLDINRWLHFIFVEGTEDQRPALEDVPFFKRCLWYDPWLGIPGRPADVDGGCLEGL